jgi:hypothetical protein
VPLFNVTKCLIYLISSTHNALCQQTETSANMVIAYRPNWWELYYQKQYWKFLTATSVTTLRPTQPNPKRRQEVKLTTCLHLMLGSRINEALPLFPHILSWGLQPLIQKITFILQSLHVCEYNLCCTYFQIYQLVINFIQPHQTLQIWKLS